MKNYVDYVNGILVSQTVAEDGRVVNETLIDDTLMEAGRMDSRQWAVRDVDGYAQQVNVLARWGDSDAEVAAAQHEQDRLIDHAGYELDKYGDVRRRAER